MTDKTRVLIADDHAFVRVALATIINGQADMQVCWQAGNGEEALLLYREHQPDIVLMDLHMPVMNGIKATRFICQEFPAACILAFTASLDTLDTDSFLQAGAKACFLKGVEAPSVILYTMRALTKKQA